VDDLFKTFHKKYDKIRPKWYYKETDFFKNLKFEIEIEYTQNCVMISGFNERLKDIEYAMKNKMFTKLEHKKFLMEYFYNNNWIDEYQKTIELELSGTIFKNLKFFEGYDKNLKIFEKDIVNKTNNMMNNLLNIIDKKVNTKLKEIEKFIIDDKKTIESKYNQIYNKIKLN